LGTKQGLNFESLPGLPGSNRLFALAWASHHYANTELVPINRFLEGAKKPGQEKNRTAISADRERTPYRRLFIFHNGCVSRRQVIYNAGHPLSVPKTQPYSTCIPQGFVLFNKNRRCAYISEQEQHTSDQIMHGSG